MSWWSSVIHTALCYMLDVLITNSCKENVNVVCFDQSAALLLCKRNNFLHIGKSDSWSICNKFIMDHF